MGIFSSITRAIVSGYPTRQRFRLESGHEGVFQLHGGGEANSVEGLSPEEIWATQPHLRTVVDFRARNCAQLGLHMFKSEGEQNVRVRGSIAHEVLKKPNGHMTGAELIYDLVATSSLHDVAYWLILPRTDGLPGKQIQPVPPSWVTPTDPVEFEVKEWTVAPPFSSRFITVKSDQMVVFPGWNALSPFSASSPVETLRLILEEQHHARVHRKQLWKRNGRIGTYITRPKDAPAWDGSARKRFGEMFEAFTGDKGERAGGSPLLEDGMELKRVGFGSADEQWSESVQLSLETVAQVFQVNPTMVGVLKAANYSNVKEFNKSLYTNTLGPILRLIEARINMFVLPLIGAGEGEFVEFNVEEKLRGSFEEQAAIMSASVGGPWMTRNEARRIRNLPPIEGGDDIITPLNVLVGGQASPQDGGEPVVEAEPKAVAAAWRKCLVRQQSVIPGKGWDVVRWDRELAADLGSMGVPGSEKLAVTLNAKAREFWGAGVSPMEVAVRLDVGVLDPDQLAIEE